VTSFEDLKAASERRLVKESKPAETFSQKLKGKVFGTVYKEKTIGKEEGKE